MCPIAAYKLYIDKLDKKSNKLWQKPRQGQLHWMDSSWYKPRNVGHTPLKSFMKTLIKNAGLETNLYTNHSIRATCIGKLDDKGFEAHHITALSSHKNESMIKTYSTKCSESKKRAMYDTLNASVVPKKQKKPETVTSGQADEFPTINFHQLNTINPGENVPCDNQDEEKLPQNFDLVPFEDDDMDDFLLQYIAQNPSENAVVPATTSVTIATTRNTLATFMPIVPKMYFPNSNVTINYNFSK